MIDITPPVEFAAWTACLTFAVMFFNQAGRAWFMLRGKPTPLEQQAATTGISERVARIEQCIGSCKNEQDKRLDALEINHAELRRVLSVEIDKVFNRINTVADLTGSMSGGLDLIKVQLNLLISASRRK